MAGAIIRDLTGNLPRSLQDAVEGYVDAVAAALPDIQRDASVKIDAHGVDAFLLIVAVRRIWAAVNSQYWTMNDTVEIARRASADISTPDGASFRGFRLGRDEISENSLSFIEGRQLRKNMEKLLSDMGIRELVAESSSLSELARRMFGTIQ
jgi:hypothetical protein